MDGTAWQQQHVAAAAQPCDWAAPSNSRQAILHNFRNTCCLQSCAKQPHLQPQAQVRDACCMGGGRDAGRDRGRDSEGRAGATVRISQSQCRIDKLTNWLTDWGLQTRTVMGHSQRHSHSHRHMAQGLGLGLGLALALALECAPCRLAAENQVKM